jgi:hypothetical protein
MFWALPVWGTKVLFSYLMDEMSSPIHGIQTYNASTAHTCSLQRMSSVG